MNMKRIILALAVVLALALTPLLGSAQDKPHRGMFAALKVGQSVNLKEADGRYVIMVMKDLAIGHKIVEIGADYVVLIDAAGVTETTIPVYSIKAIVKVKAEFK